MEKPSRDEITAACTEMVLKAMRARSRTAREGYLAAARLFALAWEQRA
jgi:hypothetical protein